MLKPVYWPVPACVLCEGALSVECLEILLTPTMVSGFSRGLRLAIQMGISRGLGPLEVHVSTEEGVCFQTDNELFLCSCFNGVYCKVDLIEAKDLSSKFQVSLLRSGKILLQDVSNMYVSCMELNGIVYLSTVKCSPDAMCEFEVFHDGEKVILRAFNGLYVCRNFRNHMDVIEASRSTVEMCCKFRTGLGDLYPPSFDILSLAWDDVSKLTCRPYVIRKEVFVNNTNEPMKHEFCLTWDTRTTDTTQWNNAWGLNTTQSAPFTLMGFEASVTYNGTFQKTASSKRSILEKRSLDVIVPEHSKVTALLVASKIDNAAIPFTAYIRKTKINGESQNLVKKGLWNGLVYDKVTLEIKQEAAWGCTIL